MLAQCYTFKYFFGSRGQTFDKMLIILSDDRKMKTGIKDMWIKIKCQCCHPSQKCSYKSWFMICQFLSPFMQWVVEGWPAVLAWPTAELSRSCKIFLQAAVILTRKGGGGAGPDRGIRNISQYGQRSSWEPRAILWTKQIVDLWPLKQSILCQVSDRKMNSIKSKV